MITAIEFGKKYDSCEEAMIWRRSLPTGTTQAEAYLLCLRGDWLIWQLTRNCVDHGKIKSALDLALEKIVARAIRRGVKSIRGNREPWATNHRRWAKKWLGGEDRSYASAAHADAVANDAAHSAVDAAVTAHAYFAYASATVQVYFAYADSAADASSYAAYSAYASVAATSTHASDAAAFASSDSYANIKAAWIKEQKQQARDIRSEIPIWPGKE